MNFSMKPAILLLASLSLAGCAVGPDYLRPSSWLPAAFSGLSATAQAEKTGPAETPAVDARWWALFQDETLNGLIETALRENADLRMAVARVEQADAAAREVGAARFPAIDAQAAGSKLHLSEKTATWTANSPETLRANSAGLSLSYEVDVWGRVRRSHEAARARLLGSQYARDSIRLSLLGQVAATYLNLRALDAQLGVTADLLADRQESREIVRVRVAEGLASPLEQFQADGALAALQAQHAELRRVRALLEHQLALLTGDGALSIPPGDIRQLPLPPQPPAGLPADLIEARPDVRAAEQQLVAANARIGMAKADYYPRFALTGSVGRESASLADLASGAAGTWSTGLGLLMPILDFGRTSARVDQARALNTESMLAWQQALQVAYKEVRDALVGLNAGRELEAAQSVRVEQARQALEVVRARYAAGQVAYLEVLDAQRNANDALLAMILSRQARLTAAVDLFKALGGGWQPEPAGG